MFILNIISVLIKLINILLKPKMTASECKDIIVDAGESFLKGEFEESEKFLLKAREGAQRLRYDQKNVLAFCYYNRGVLLFKQQKYKKSFVFFNKALKVFSNKIGDDHSYLEWFYRNLAAANFLLNNIPEAKQLSEKCSLIKKTPNKKVEIKCVDWIMGGLSGLKWLNFPGPAEDIYYQKQLLDKIEETFKSDRQKYLEWMKYFLEYVKEYYTKDVIPENLRNFLKAGNIDNIYPYIVPRDYLDHMGKESVSLSMKLGNDLFVIPVYDLDGAIRNLNMVHKFLKTDDVCISIPQREVMIIFQKGDKSFRDEMRAMIKEKEQDAVKPLTWQFFTFDEKGIVPFREP